jgi:hypothetical protein
VPRSLPDPKLGGIFALATNSKIGAGNKVRIGSVRRAFRLRLVSCPRESLRSFRPMLA